MKVECLDCGAMVPATSLCLHCPGCTQCCPWLASKHTRIPPILDVALIVLVPVVLLAAYFIVLVVAS